mgnify:CR=1 FL=1
MKDLKNPTTHSKTSQKKKHSKTLPEKSLQERHMLPRVKTGIVGLDEMLNGGLPKDIILLLAGSSGSGKTILCLQWLFDGVKNGENGMYITMTESLFMTLRNAETMSFFDRKAVEDEKLLVLDIRDILDHKTFNQEKTLKFIEDHVKKHKVQRLVIDSITAILYIINDRDKVRSFIFELNKVLATLGCTTILTSEIPKEGSYSVYGVEEYISDGIICLTNIPGENQMVRRLQVIKMRGIEFRTGAVIFDINSDGLIIYPKIPIDLKVASTEFKIRLDSGVPKFNQLIGGGYPQGHMVMLVGNTGSGKTTFGIHFLMAGLKKNEPCLYVALEESITQIKKTATGHGLDLEKYEKSGILKFLNPGLIDIYPDRILYDIVNTTKKMKLKRIVFDSTSSLESAAINKNQVREFLLQFAGFCKSFGITCVFTYLSESVFESRSGNLLGGGASTELRLSSIVDGIIMLRYVERGQRVEKLLHVLKLRGSSHDKNIWQYTTEQSGIKIGNKFKKKV